MSELLETVVRFHDTRRLPELSRAVFSLVAQSYRPLRIILVTQRFTDADIATTRAALAPLIPEDDEVDLSVVNWPEAEPRDARSVLLNLGVKQGRGRYLAFLDYDDVLYPEAYELLVGRLEKTGAAIAFASVRIMHLQVFSQYFYADATAPPFWGQSLLNLFHSNFCPLHSYVMDRRQVPANLLSFRPNLTIEEDYDVLLRVCARYRSDFALIGTHIGDYYYKSDGSNTIPHDGAPLSDEMTNRYKDVNNTIEYRRRTTLVSPLVRGELGVQYGLKSAPKYMTVRDVLDHFS